MNAALEVRHRFIVDAKGRKKAVVIPFDAYEKLMEDLADLAAAAERRDEQTVSHEQLLKDLKTMASFRLEWRASAAKELRKRKKVYR